MSKQNNILISVIIPSYNRADTVGETIESIVAQEGLGTEFDVEIVMKKALKTLKNALFSCVCQNKVVN